MSDNDWRPSATIESLKLRAAIMASIRQFFSERDVLEVETPLLARFGVTDPHMDLVTADNPLGEGERYYLQTSPEYAMKRLLAAGSGPIYQMGKAFRAGEVSSRHNPEFTMLEWYRPGFDHHQLMDEIAALLMTILDCPRPQQISYAELFEQQLGINPHRATATALESVAKQHIDIQMSDASRDDWLNLLIAEVIEPRIGFDAPLFIYDYPASQAALAKLANNAEGDPVAERFELYVQGVELANGYHELTDAAEQQRRIQAEQQFRAELQRPAMAEDRFLVQALKHGLPASAGVALGLDRLVMLALDTRQIDDVLSFSHSRT